MDMIRISGKRTLQPVTNLGRDQSSDDRLELIGRLRDRQRARIDHGQVERVRLAAKIRRPLIHLAVGKLRLLPRAV